MPTAGAVAGAGAGAGVAVAVASATTSCAASTVSGWLSFAQTISRVVEVVFVRLITTAKMPALALVTPDLYFTSVPVFVLGVADVLAVGVKGAGAGDAPEVTGKRERRLECFDVVFIGVEP